MNVTHLAMTPLAGSPIRIVNALNNYTNIYARLVIFNSNIYGNRTYPGDLDWNLDREEAIAAITNADIIHFHHYINLEHNPFNINFKSLNKKIIRQFHSHPIFIAQGKKNIASEIIHSDIPQLVIAQYHERFFPRARVVPNIIPVNDEFYSPKTDKDESSCRIFYSSTTKASAFEHEKRLSRWDTKGYFETLDIINELKKSNQNIYLDLCVDQPYENCLIRKRNSHIAIDEMVTGSYHLSGLESLALALPTLSYLDSRTLGTLEKMTGTNDCPFINIRLEESFYVLQELIRDSSLRKEIGEYSRSWILKYYNDKEMIKYYTGAYDDLFNDPYTFNKDLLGGGKKRLNDWYAKDLHELAWKSRESNNVKKIRLINNIINFFKRQLKKLA